MLLRRIFDPELAQAAYLIGCQRTGEALVTDAQRDVDRYIEEAAQEGLRIVAVTETHIHADFLAGTRELAERVGAKVYLSGCGGEDWQYGWLQSDSQGQPYSHELLAHDSKIRIGNIELTAQHTPGHTPEHISFLVTDHGGGAQEPMGLLSGDFVFVGDLGRPDLLETAAGITGSRDESARALHGSAQKFLNLPDYLQVWPAHGAGSACGKALGAVPQSTAGYEKRFNPALSLVGQEQQFVDFMTAGQPEPPLYFARMKRENRDGPAVLGTLPNPPLCGLETLPFAANDDAVVVDTRDWTAFRAGHVPGSLWAPLGRHLPNVCGSYVLPEQKIYLIVDREDVDHAVRSLVRIGLDRVAGYVAPATLTAHGRGEGELQLANIDEIESTEYRGRLAQEEVQALDVRRLTEYDEGHIPSALNVAHTRLLPRLEEVPRGRPIVVSCQTGIRSGFAASFLKRNGFEVINLRGGYEAWVGAGGDVAK